MPIRWDPNTGRIISLADTQENDLQSRLEAQRLRRKELLGDTQAITQANQQFVEANTNDALLQRIGSLTGGVMAGLQGTQPTSQPAPQPDDGTTDSLAENLSLGLAEAGAKAQGAWGSFMGLVGRAEQWLDDRTFLGIAIESMGGDLGEWGTIYEKEGARLREEAAAMLGELSKTQPGGDGAIETVANWVTRHTVAQLPNVIAGIGTAILTRSPSATMTVAFGSSFFTEAAFQEAELKEAGLDDETAWWLSLSAAMPIAALDAVTNIEIAKGLMRALGTSQSGGLISDAVRRLVANRNAQVLLNYAGLIGTESVTEAVQELINMGTTMYGAGVTPEMQEAIYRLSYAAKAGAAGAGGLGGANVVANLYSNQREASLERRAANAIAELSVADLPDGVVINGKVKQTDAKGRVYFTYEDGRRGRAKHPSLEEISAWVDEDVEKNTLLLMGHMQANKPTAKGIDTDGLIASILNQDGTVDQGKLFRHVWANAASFRSSALDLLEELSPSDYEARIAAYEEIVENPEASWPARITAQGRALAMLRVRALSANQQDGSYGGNTLDRMLQARVLASREDIGALQTLLTDAQAAGDAELVQLYEQAIFLKNNKTISAGKEVNDWLRGRRTVPASITVGAKVMTEEGEGTVVHIHPDGHVEVALDGQTDDLTADLTAPSLRVINEITPEGMTTPQGMTVEVIPEGRRRLGMPEGYTRPERQVYELTLRQPDGSTTVEYSLTNPLEARDEFFSQVEGELINVEALDPAVIFTNETISALESRLTVKEEEAQQARLQARLEADALAEAQEMTVVSEEIAAGIEDGSIVDEAAEPLPSNLTWNPSAPDSYVSNGDLPQASLNKLIEVLDKDIQAWMIHNGTPLPEAAVPIISAMKENFSNLSYRAEEGPGSSALGLQLIEALRSVGVDFRVVPQEAYSPKPSRPSKTTPRSIEEVKTNPAVRTLDSSAIKPAAEPGKTARTTSGESGVVVSTDKQKVTIEKPTGEKITAPVEEIEETGTTPAKTEEHLSTTELSPEERKALTLRTLKPFPQPIEMSDGYTGQTHTVIGFGQDGWAFTAAGEVIAPNTLKKPTPQVETFKPGTKPTSRNRHVNFLQVPVAEKEEFLKAMRSDDPAVRMAALRRYPLYLVPQPWNTETVTFAVEMDDHARVLSPQAKQLLSFLGGKKEAVTHSERRARVELDPLANSLAMKVSEAPKGLVMQMNQLLNEAEVPQEQMRDWMLRVLRGSTDLGFPADTDLAKTVEEITRAEEAAAAARLAGDIARAEVLEIAALRRKQDAGVKVMDNIDESLKNLWKAVSADIDAELSPEEVSLVDAFRRTSAEHFARVTGIGPALSEDLVSAIRDYERAHGPFMTLNDLDVLARRGSLWRANPNFGPSHLQRILDGIRSGVIPRTRSTTLTKDSKLAGFLKDLLPADGNPYNTVRLNYRHPTIPQLRMVVSKRTIDFAQRSSLPRAILRVREMPAFRDTLRPEQIVALLTDFQKTKDLEQTLTKAVKTKVVSGAVAEEIRKTSKVLSGSRPVYTVEFIADDIGAGRVIHSRDVSTARMTFKLPIHWLTYDKNGLTKADNYIQNRLSENPKMPLDDIIDEMLEIREDVKYVRIRGVEGAESPKAYRVLAVENGKIDPRKLNFDDPNVQLQDFNITLQDIDQKTGIGKTFNIRSSQLMGEDRTVRENEGYFSYNKQVTESEVVNEVIREVRRFGTEAEFISAGEWRSQFPHIYGTIQSIEGGFSAILMEKSDVEELPSVFIPSKAKFFASLEEAEEFLTGLGFWKTDYSKALAKTVSDFQSLPRPDFLFSLDNTRLIWEAHNTLKQILADYSSHGYIPQPVRDYAYEFSEAYRNYSDRGGTLGRILRKSGGLFGGFGVRRSLGLYEPKDSFRLAPKRAEGQSITTRLSSSGRTAGAAIATQSFESDDLTLVPGRVVLKAPGQVRLKPMQAALRRMEMQSHRERFTHLMDSDDRTLPANDRLVTTEDGRIGIVLNSNPGGDSMTVQFADTENSAPSIEEISKEALLPVKSQSMADDFYRTMKDVIGEASNYPAIRDFGLSPLDKQVGLSGITDLETYHDKLRYKVAEILRSLSWNPTTRAIDGDIRTVVQQLLPYWIRMKELGLSNAAHPTYLNNKDGSPKQRFTQKYNEHLASLNNAAAHGILPPTSRVADTLTLTGKRLPLVPEVLRMHLDLETLKYYDNLYSGSNPFGRIMGLAASGRMTQRTMKDILAQAKRAGVDTDRPFLQVVQDMIAHVWDPEVAQALWTVRNDIGALFLSRSAWKDLPPEAMPQLTVPSSPRTWRFEQGVGGLTFPRTLAAEHPVFRAFLTLAEKARTRYGNLVAYGRDIIHGLHAPGLGLDSGFHLKGGPHLGPSRKVVLSRKRLIWDLLKSEALGELQKSPSEILSKKAVLAALPDATKSQLFPNWYEHYKTLRALFVEGREIGIRNALIRGFSIEPLNNVFESLMGDNSSNPLTWIKELDNAVRLKHELNLTENEFQTMVKLLQEGKTPYRLVRTSNPAFARPKSEVDFFLKLINSYKDVESIPEDVKANMVNWQVEEFDFWQRYGISNYVPTILQGNHKIIRVGPDGTDEIVGVTPDGETARLFFLRVYNGEIEGLTRDDLPNLRIKLGRSSYDEIDQTFLGTERLKNMWGKIYRTVNEEEYAKQLTAEIMQTLRFGSEKNIPSNLHLKQKTAELEELIEDPYRRALIWWSRIARSEYMLDVDNAYESARRNDLALSRSTGQPALFAPGGATELARYMTDLRDSFLGREGFMEGAANNAMAIAVWLPHAMKTLGRRQVKKIFNTIESKSQQDPNYRPLSDPEVAQWIWNPKFASRELAAAMTKLQSALRLGGNWGSAIVNATQHLAVTPTYLIMRGAKPSDAIKDSIEVYKDVFKYMTGDEKFVAENEDFLREAGIFVVPIRGTAGPGINLDIGSTPSTFSDVSVGKKIEETAMWLLMLPFGKAEESVRLASAFAARRTAERMGLDYEAQIAFAKDVVDNTQFQYYDQSLPPAMRGNFMSVITQFLQYPANQFKFEKDLLKAAITGRFQGRRTIRTADGRTVPVKEVAKKAAATYLGTGFAMGGVHLIGSRPLVAPLVSSLTLIGFLTGSTLNPLQWLMAKEGEEEEDKYPGPEVGPPFRGVAESVENFWRYGTPGIFNLYLSERMGVSGLPINLQQPIDLFLGPSGALYRDIYSGLFTAGRSGQEGFAANSKKTAALGLGGTIAILLSRGKLTAENLAIAPIASTVVAGLLTDERGVGDWMVNNKGGRRFAQSVLPNWLINEPTGLISPSRGLSMTEEIFSPLRAEFLSNPYELFKHPIETLEEMGDIMANNPAIVYDENFSPRSYPGLLNATFESLAAFTGLETVTGAEERVFNQVARQRIEAYRNERSTFIQAAANSAIRSGLWSEGTLKILRAAQEANHYITFEDIRERMQVNRRSLSDQVREGGSALGRTLRKETIPDLPGGRDDR